MSDEQSDGARASLLASGDPSLSDIDRELAWLLEKMNFQQRYPQKVDWEDVQARASITLARHIRKCEKHSRFERHSINVLVGSRKRMAFQELRRRINAHFQRQKLEEQEQQSIPQPVNHHRRWNCASAACINKLFAHQSVHVEEGYGKQKVSSNKTMIGVVRSFATSKERVTASRKRRKLDSASGDEQEGKERLYSSAKLISSTSNEDPASSVDTQSSTEEFSETKSKPIRSSPETPSDPPQKQLPKSDSSPKPHTSINEVEDNITIARLHLYIRDLLDSFTRRRA
jgi:hypothetical protein